VSLADALTTPRYAHKFYPRYIVYKCFEEEKTIYKWSQDPRCQVSYTCLSERIKKNGCLRPDMLVRKIRQPKLKTPKTLNTFVYIVPEIDPDLWLCIIQIYKNPTKLTKDEMVKKFVCNQNIYIKTITDFNSILYNLFYRNKYKQTYHTQIYKYDKDQDNDKIFQRCIFRHVVSKLIQGGILCNKVKEC
jgi:hypothetical protein